MSTNFEQRSITEIPVDFNAANGDLMTYSLRRASGGVAPGDAVIVYDPAETDMRYFARVEEVTDEGRGARFRIDFASIPPRRICSCCDTDWTDWTGEDAQGCWSSDGLRYCSGDCVVLAGRETPKGTATPNG